MWQIYPSLQPLRFLPKIPEIDFEILQKYSGAQLIITKRSHILDFKPLCHLVWSIDSFEINRGYTAENSQ